MNRFHLFRALNPTTNYPASPINLCFNGVRYDLILPPRVGIAFSRQLSPKGSLKRIEDYCSPTGFDTLRTKPDSFTETRNLAAYAESDSQVETIDQGVPVGYIAQLAAANVVAAKKILMSVISGKFTFDVVDWLFGHAPFLDYSGGFELAHVCCYASTEERETAIAAANGEFDDAEPNMYRPHVTTIRLDSPNAAMENRP